MKSKNYKTIRIYESDFYALDELCKRYNLTKTEMIETFLIYFKKTGIDPSDPTDTTTEVKKLKNQLISFIRTQEKEKLDPLIKRNNALINSFFNHLDNDGITKEFLTKALTETGRQIIQKLKDNSNAY